jgi:hypothetical protein
LNWILFTTNVAPRACEDITNCPGGDVDWVTGGATGIGLFVDADCLDIFICDGDKKFEIKLALSFMI